jgi:hypothetical protein
MTCVLFIFLSTEVKNSSGVATYFHVASIMYMCIFLYIVEIL